MNTVMRTLGGALGGQLAATFIVNNTVHGVPRLAGFTDSFLLAGGFLIVCTLSAVLVPGNRAERRGRPLEPQLASAHESG
jgi:hypothetical protein